MKSSEGRSNQKQNVNKLQLKSHFSLHLAPQKTETKVIITKLKPFLIDKGKQIELKKGLRIYTKNQVNV